MRSVSRIGGVWLLFVLQAVGCATHPARAPGIVAATIVPTHAGQPDEVAFEATPAWQDEFNDTGRPDPLKWGYDLGNNNGWGNQELEQYTDHLANAWVGDGVLTITARHEQLDGRDYTSARLVSKGKGDVLYGRVEVRAKLPAGRGTWPAIWMLPTDWAYGDWPHSGEIDIMEQVGFDPEVIHFSAHTGAYYHLIGTQKTAIKAIGNATTAFHRYRVDWTPDMIRGYIDDVPMFAFANEHKGSEVWPFDKRFYLILNIAVGGFWGEQKGIDDTIFPASMQVDYVRVYRMAKPARH